MSENKEAKQIIHASEGGSIYAALQTTADNIIRLLQQLAALNVPDPEGPSMIPLWVIRVALVLIGMAIAMTIFATTTNCTQLECILYGSMAGVSLGFMAGCFGAPLLKAISQRYIEPWFRNNWMPLDELQMDMRLNAVSNLLRTEMQSFLNTLLIANNFNRLPQHLRNSVRALDNNIGRYTVASLLHEATMLRNNCAEQAQHAREFRLPNSLAIIVRSIPPPEPQLYRNSLAPSQLAPEDKKESKLEIKIVHPLPESEGQVESKTDHSVSEEQEGQLKKAPYRNAN